jgi:hypothetical protein
LPKSWQSGDDDAKESKKPSPVGEIRLFESATTLEAIVLKEAKADYEIKLIAPGAGSSAYYPKEVLQRDGPKVFKAGTHVYLNHPTAAEEAQRPEGDVKNLAGVLSTDAAYSESHAKGPGLYARMKVFADHGQTVEEKAPHVGMSIRASGVAEAGKKMNGVPVLKELTSAESVDVVTRAGAGGMILTEAAKPQEGELTKEEAQRLIESGIRERMAPLEERLLKADAREEITSILEGVTLPEAAKKRIAQRVLENVPSHRGELDTAKLREAVVKEAKAEGEYLAQITGSGRVLGFGAPALEEVKPEEAERREKDDKKRFKEARNRFMEDFGMTKEQAEFAVRGRVA